MSIGSIQNERKRYAIPTYSPLPVAFKKGKGAYITSTQGKRYIDFLSGIAVTNLGHAHPKVVSAIKNATKSVLHTSNLYEIEPQVKLAKALSKHALHGKTFFCNSGAEANEAAYKLALRYGHSISPAKEEVITLTGSFHGRTLGALTLTGQEKHRKGFPRAGLVTYTPINDVAALKEKMTENTAALFIEVIQGEGGVNIMDDEFYTACRKLTKEHKALLIVDEVQTGMGRTGHLFGYQDYEKHGKPDAITLAKGLGNGIPIGALHVAEKFADTFLPGDHASTFGGNHFVTTVAKTVLDVTARSGFLANVRKMSDLILTEMKRLKNRYPIIEGVRAKGLMLAMDFNVSANSIFLACFDKGLLVNAIADKTLRMLPPLTITRKEVREAMAILEEVIKEEHARR